MDNNKPVTVSSSSHEMDPFARFYQPAGVLSFAGRLSGYGTAGSVSSSGRLGRYASHGTGMGMRSEPAVNTAGTAFFRGARGHMGMRGPGRPVGGFRRPGGFFRSPVYRGRRGGCCSMYAMMMLVLVVVLGFIIF